MTFDIFGTVLDWETGLAEACRAAGRPLRAGEFDRIIDVQGRLEQGDFLDYVTVTQRSLVDVLGLGEDQAREIGAAAGRWPLYPDAPVLRSLMLSAPCAAMTNSDQGHGEDVQAALGFRLSAWLCAEDVGAYKPDRRFWQAMAELRDVQPSSEWWHVSAYGDYDLAAATELGLTTVFVGRRHSRPSPSTHVVDDLRGLLAVLSS